MAQRSTKARLASLLALLMLGGLVAFLIVNGWLFTGGAAVGIGLGR